MTANPATNSSRLLVVKQQWPRSSFLTCLEVNNFWRRYDPSLPMTLPRKFTSSIYSNEVWYCLISTVLYVIKILFSDFDLFALQVVNAVIRNILKITVLWLLALYVIRGIHFLKDCNMRWALSNTSMFSLEVHSQTKTPKDKTQECEQNWKVFSGTRI